MPPLGSGMEIVMRKSIITLTLLTTLLTACYQNSSDQNSEITESEIITNQNDTTTDAITISIETKISLDEALSYYIIEKYKSELSYMDGEIEEEAHIIMKTIDNDKEIICYVMPWYSKFTKKEDGSLEETGSTGIVCKITLTHNDNGEYKLIDYWEPGDGAYFIEDIKEVFPKDIQNDAINSVQLYYKTLQDDIIKKVKNTP